MAWLGYEIVLLNKEKKVEEIRQQVESKVEQFHQKLAEAEQSRQSLKADIQRYEEESQNYQVRIQSLDSLVIERQSRLNEANQSFFDSQKEIEVRNQQIQTLESELEAATQQLKLTEKISPQASETISELQNTVNAFQVQLEQILQEKSNYENNRLLQKQKIENYQTQKNQNYVNQLQEQLESQNATTNEYQRRLEETLQDIQLHELNPFELKVFNTLKNSPQCQQQKWLITPQYNASSHIKFTQITDFLVISQGLIFVLEVKKYEGKIISKSEASSSEWVCLNSQGKEIPIHASSGKNPYLQVTKYSNAIYGKLQDKIRKKRLDTRVATLGIVVFPKSADLSAIQSQIKPYCWLLTLDQLLNTLPDLENKHRPRYPNLLTASQINDLL